MHCPNFIDLVAGDESHRMACRSPQDCILCALRGLYFSMTLQKIVKPERLRLLLCRKEYIVVTVQSVFV